VYTGEEWELLLAFSTLKCRTLDPDEVDDLTPTKPAGGAGLT